MNLKGLSDVELCQATEKALGEVRCHSAASGKDWFNEMKALSKAEEDLDDCEEELYKRDIEMLEVSNENGLIRTYVKSKVVFTTERN